MAFRCQHADIINTSEAVADEDILQLGVGMRVTASHEIILARPEPRRDGWEVVRSPMSGGPVPRHEAKEPVEGQKEE